MTPEEQMEQLREKITWVMFCKQNCNMLKRDCCNNTCHLIFKHEKKQYGWPFVLADSIISLLSAAGLGWRGKILTKEQYEKAATHLHNKHYNDIQSVLTAQRDQFISLATPAQNLPKAMVKLVAEWAKEEAKSGK